VFAYDEVFWLNVTNLVLGLVTLSCVLVIGYAVIKEIRERARATARVTENADDHAFVVTGLGITMADGGEKLDSNEMLVVTEDGIESVPRADGTDDKNRKGGK
jgi:hypothetical protein